MMRFNNDKKNFKDEKGKTSGFITGMHDVLNGASYIRIEMPGRMLCLDFLDKLQQMSDDAQKWGESAAIIADQREYINKLVKEKKQHKCGCGEKKEPRKEIKNSLLEFFESQHEDIATKAADFICKNVHDIADIKSRLTELEKDRQ
jgi:hypothetical protein